jgi:cellulose synthase/poly-beta-1,6-N-acetylglucosamine synthase-like glycosyltransferase
MRISIMIAVYKEAELLGDIIRKLLENNYPDKEILVAVDGEVTQDIETALEPYRADIGVYYNFARLGKVNSLNRLRSNATGDAFLFLDNDIELPEDQLFLTKLNDYLIEFDIVEMPKEAVIKNRFSRIVGYDFLSAAMFGFVTAKIFKRNLFLNGAAFTVRRRVFEELGGFPKVVNEDWAFMTKAFEAKKSYAFPLSLKVKNTVPASFPEWIEQRKRWALGTAYFIKQLPRLFKGFPIILIIAVFFLIPAIISVAMGRFDLIDKILLLTLTALKQNFGVNLGAIYLISYFSIILQGWASILTALSISGTTFFIFARILKFRFNIFEFTIYYLFYTPLLVLAYLVYGIAGSFRKLKFDWKI